MYKKDNNSNMVNRFSPKFDQLDLIMLKTLTHVKIWLHLTVLEIYAKICCLTPMFYFFRILKGTNIVSFIQIHSEEISDEKMYTDGHRPGELINLPRQL